MEMPKGTVRGENKFTELPVSLQELFQDKRFIPMNSPLCELVCPQILGVRNTNDPKGLAAHHVLKPVTCWAQL